MLLVVEAVKVSGCIDGTAVLMVYIRDRERQTVCVLVRACEAVLLIHRQRDRQPVGFIGLTKPATLQHLTDCLCASLCLRVCI